MTDADSPSDDWASRVGARAAGARRTSARSKVIGVVLLALVPLSVIVVVLLFVTQDGNPTVPEVATAVSVGVVGGLVGFGFLSTAFDQHNRAIDSTVAFLRPRYPDVSAADAHELLASTDSFDSGMSGRVATAPNGTPGARTLAWTPDIVRPIQPGIPQSTLVSIHRWIGGTASVGLIALALLAIVHLAPARPIWYSAWGVVVFVFAISFAFWLAAIARGHQEFRAGYTTSPTGTQLVSRGQNRPVDAHTSLDFVDGKTGYLLRHSDSVLLSASVYQGRLHQIRAAHPGVRPARISSVQGEQRRTH